MSWYQIPPPNKKNHIHCPSYISRAPEKSEGRRKTLRGVSRPSLRSAQSTANQHGSACLGLIHPSWGVSNHAGHTHRNEAKCTKVRGRKQAKKQWGTSSRSQPDWQRHQCVATQCVFLNSLRGRPCQKLPNCKKEAVKNVEKNIKSLCSRQLYFQRKVSVHAHREGRTEQIVHLQLLLIFPQREHPARISASSFFFFEKSIGQSSTTRPSRHNASRLQRGGTHKAQEFSEAAQWNVTHLHYTCEKKKSQCELQIAQLAGHWDRREGITWEAKSKSGWMIFFPPAQHSRALEHWCSNLEKKMRATNTISSILQKRVSMRRLIDSFNWV